MGVEAVLFDIDDTVCAYRRTTAEVLSAAFERAGVAPFFTAREYVDRYNDFADDSDGIVDLRTACFAAIAREKGRDPSVGRAVARAYARERDHTNVRFRPGADETIERLHGAVPLAAVTNGSPAMQSTKLDVLGIADRFETVVHAGYDAPAKPSPEPFEAALETIGVPAGRAIHVGNSLASDVAGAKRAGLRTAWLADEDTEETGPEPDHVIESMGELAALIEGLR